MLDELIVHNLGVISEARLEPGDGMVVVTGETGAGKTLLLGALRLLMGANARSDQIGPADDQARVEGRLLFGEDELVVARRVSEGRSRAYLDGGMVSARAVGDRLDGAVEIVGQHDQLGITRSRELRRLVDRRLIDAKTLERYATAWDRVAELRLAQRQLGGDRRRLERERDLLAYQLDEIDQASFEPGEDASLERAAARMTHAERIVELSATAHAALDEARSDMGDAIAAVRHLAELDPSSGALVGIVEGLDAELAEATVAARDAGESVEMDAEALEVVQERLTLLGDLRRKYGADLDEILSFRAESAARHEELASLLDRAASIDSELDEATSSLKAAGEALRQARRAAAALVTTEALEHLVELGFTDPILEIVIENADPSPEGADRVEVVFASDRRLTPGPISKVASGGELSRLVLSLRLASGAGAARVVAFDEIDSGVGGSTALAMGAKLAALAEGRQVLCVTHLPQVAAFAHRHFVVRREGAEASVELVEGERRLEELSRMLSGLPESDRGREHAEELLERARATRAG